MEVGAPRAPEITGVFISYSRTDGAEIAHQLRDKLTQHNVNVWLDTDQIRGGDSWTSELDAALSSCDVLLAVLTESSYKSGICRAEQLFAVEHGKRVIPVLTAPSVPRPTHLYGLNYRLFPEEQRALLADLDIAPKTPDPDLAPNHRHYSTVPDLPPNFVPRDEALFKLQALVFTEDEQHPAAVTAVAGMGGIGKSVLTASLCQDLAVRRAFPGGIAWITLGREWSGDSTAAMRHLATALGAVLRNEASALACQTRYQELVREKAALIVIDDVWDLSHLQPLLLSAPQSRFLFTTRDLGIARAVAARKHRAELLNSAEGRRLLAQSAGLQVERLPDEADAIVETCNGLALAIAQIGGTLRDRSAAAWRDVLDLLQTADITGFEELLPPGQRSFFKSLAVSVDQALPHMRDRYRSLAVMLEDDAVHCETLRTLWALNAAETRRTCSYLVERSLATWESPVDPDRGIRLHDLQLDYLRAVFPERTALSLIHEATRLSAPVINRDSRQYASQLIGRLLGGASIAGIDTFLERLQQGAPKPWLRPLYPSLRPPGAEVSRTFKGHSSRVNSVALSVNGMRAVSASADKTLKVWDLKSGRALRTLEGHSDSVSSVALTVDGMRAVSASADQTLKVWDLESGRTLRTLKGHSSRVNSVALTADGKRALSASADKTLKVWDLESGRTLRTLTSQFYEFRIVAVTADGKRAISLADSKERTIWDLENGRELRHLGGIEDWEGYVTSVALTADGKRAISASPKFRNYSHEDDPDEYTPGTLKVWDVESGRLLDRREGYYDSVTSVALRGDGTRVVSASDDNTLAVCDLESRRTLATFHCDSSVLCCSYNLALVIAGDALGQVHVLQLEENTRQTN
jgi:WD40 repeat protein